MKQSTAATSLFDTLTHALNARCKEEREAAIEALLTLACSPEQGPTARASRRLLANCSGIFVLWHGPALGWEIRSASLGAR